MAAEHGPTIDGVVRQSTLRTMDSCPQAAMWEADGHQDWSTGPQALGTAFHLVMEEMLRTLKAQEETQISTEEAIVIMEEILVRPDCPHLSATQMRALRVMVLNFCEHTWTVRHGRFEERLSCEVPCPDGKRRMITGKPDVMLPNGANSVLILDAKTGWQVPPAPRGWDGTGIPEGEQYLSARGHFQGDTLGLLVMRNFPRVDSTVFREFFPRLNEMREAVLHRGALEHVERRLGVLAQRWEMMQNGELEPEARPGTHCSYCPKPTSCPIDPERRAEGAIDSDEVAAEYATALPVVDAQREHLRKATKAWVDVHGNIEIPGGFVGWKAKKSGNGRDFAVHKDGED